MKSIINIYNIILNILYDFSQKVVFAFASHPAFIQNRERALGIRVQWFTRFTFPRPASRASQTTGREIRRFYGLVVPKWRRDVCGAVLTAFLWPNIVVAVLLAADEDWVLDERLQL